MAKKKDDTLATLFERFKASDLTGEEFADHFRTRLRLEPEFCLEPEEESAPKEKRRTGSRPGAQGPADEKKAEKSGMTSTSSA